MSLQTHAPARNPFAQRRYNLRNIAIPFLGGQDRPSAGARISKIRRRAGKQAWTTRLARYGPKGRKSSSVAPVSAANPPTVIVVQPRPPPAAVVEDGAATSEHGEYGMEDVQDDQDQDQAGAPTAQDAPIPLQPAPPHQTPLPPPTLSPTSSLHHLLNSRRARLLGPQDITRPQPPPRRPEIEIWRDDEAGLDEQGGDERVVEGENEENVPPAWVGGEAPPAPGARRAVGWTGWWRGWVRGG